MCDRPGEPVAMLPLGTRLSKSHLARYHASGAPIEPRGGTNFGVGSWVGGLDQTPTARRRAMTLLKWALIFFLVSVVAGILGFTGISAASADIARFLFYVFVVIFLVLLILGLTIFRV
jgi:uncharacterized membrane protein YtjA (UPF0391 family)